LATKTSTSPYFSTACISISQLTFFECYILKTLDACHVSLPAPQ
jgi:hypothetical protein